MFALLNIVGDFLIYVIVVTALRPQPRHDCGALCYRTYILVGGRNATRLPAAFIFLRVISIDVV
jgi:hypothetical protein